MAQHPFAAFDFPCADIGVLAASLEDATREWREEIGDVDEDTVVWQPFPGGHSIGGLILHMADAEGWWFEEMAGGKSRPDGEAQMLLSEETKQYGVEWPVPPRQPLSWYYDVADKVRQRSLRTLAELDDPDRYVEGEGWSRSYNVRWIVAHVAGHESYHGGQAVLLKIIKQKLAEKAMPPDAPSGG